MFPVPGTLSELSVTFNITFRMLLSSLSFKLASWGLPAVFTMLLSLSVATPEGSFCNDLKLELRLQLRQRLEKDKERYELVKHKDTRVYLRYIYN